MNQFTRAENSIHFSKPPRLIESASTEPIRVIQEVFNSVFIEDLRDDLLPRWLRTVVINDNSIYANTDQRTQLLHFYDHLIVFTEAMQVISEQQKHVTKQSEPDEDKLQVLLTEDQKANPLQVVAEFRKQFPIDYVRRELWHFLEAGVSHSGDYPDGFAPGYALMVYDYISCLTEAAYCLGD